MSRIRDAMLQSAALSLLVGAMAAMDRNLRSQIVNLVAGDAGRELSVIMAPTERLGRFAVQTFNEYRIENEVMFAFVVISVVLCAFLFRS